MIPAGEPARFRHISLAAEDIEDYRPGGYHPVHLGDLLNTYLVVRKLGYGCFSTVWLARDARRPPANSYVALKVLTAAHSAQTSELEILTHISRAPPHPGRTHVTPLLDHFELHGQNGKHLCLVLEVMGPSAEMMEYTFRVPGQPWKHVYPAAVSKEIARQITLGLGFLHSNGVIHGDIQPGNILFSLPDLASMTDADVEQDQGADTMEYVKRLDGQPLDSSTPRYIVAPQPLTGRASADPGFQVKLSDLGGAFFARFPGAKAVTPVALRPPELILGTAPQDEKSDIWSLACVIYQLTTGNPLFNLPFGESRENLNDEHLLQLTEVLGPPPPTIATKWKSMECASGRMSVDLERVPKDTLEQALVKRRPADMAEEEASGLVKVLRGMLKWEKEERVELNGLADWFGKESEDAA